MNPVIAILLSGGKGLRLGGKIPKQYLSLNGIPIALYSFVKLLECPQISSVIVVCEEEDRHYYDLHRQAKEDLEALSSDVEFLLQRQTVVQFALPGARRQDSMRSGLQKVKDEEALIISHDAARPFINEKKLLEMIVLSKTGVASALALPVVLTIKEISREKEVIRTVPRESLWQMNTPQIVPYHILIQAFELAEKRGISLTDELSFAELIGYPARLVEDHPYNLKITHPIDLDLAELILQRLIPCITSPS